MLQRALAVGRALHAQAEGQVVVGTGSGSFSPALARALSCKRTCDVGAVLSALERGDWSVLQGASFDR